MNEKFNCDQPLKDPRHEKFCQLRAQGVSQKDAYREAGFNATESSIHQAASRLAARPEVKTRIKSLQLDALAGTGPITPSEIRKRLEFVVRSSSSSGDIVRASQMLKDEFGVTDKDPEAIKVSPDQLLAYITNFAGREGKEIVQELGGAEFMARRLSEILKVPVTVDGEGAR